jgi:hypothetical protein
MQASVHPASTADPPGGRARSPQFAWQPHVHVDGQSESTVHAPVCWAAHVFVLVSVHVVPASQRAGMAGKPESGGGTNGGGMGTALHGTVVTVTYGGWLASWSFPQSYPVRPGEHVNPGPQSVSATHGASHSGTQAFRGPPSVRRG